MASEVPTIAEEFPESKIAGLVPPHLERDTTTFSTVEAYEATVKSELGLLETYQQRATVKALAHGAAAQWYLRTNKLWLAYPATVLALVTTFLSSQLPRSGWDISEHVEVGVAIVTTSALSALFSSTGTFLQYDKLAMAHNASADQYADLAGDIELFLSTRSRVNGRNILESFLRQQHAVMDVYDKGAPKIHESFAATAETRYQAGKKHLSGRCRYDPTESQSNEHHIELAIKT